MLLSSFSLKTASVEGPRHFHLCGGGRQGTGAYVHVAAATKKEERKKNVSTAACRPKEFKRTVVISDCRAAVDYPTWHLCFTATVKTAL